MCIRDSGSDAKWVFVSDMLTRAEYEEQYPGKEIAPWEEGTIGDEYKSWSTSTHVRIAWYYYQDVETRKAFGTRSILIT